MQNENMLLPLNAWKNHKKVMSLYLALLYGAVSAAGWPSASNNRLYESFCKRTGDALTDTWHSHSHSSLAGEQQCHDWITYPHKTLSIIHIFIAQEKMHWIRMRFCPTDVHSSEKSLYFPHSTEISFWKLS